MINTPQIKRTLTAAGAALLLLACGGQQTTPDAKMSPAPSPVTTQAMPTQPLQPVAKVESTAKAGALDPMQLRVEQSMLRATTAIRDAREVGADLYASQTLQRAIDQLRTAVLWRDSGRVLDAIAQANLSANTAIAAHAEAKPQHVVAVAKAMQSKYAVNLMAELSADPATQPVRTEDGLIVALVGAFLPMDKSLSAAGTQKLSELARIASKYPTFDLVLSASSTDDDSAKTTDDSATTSLLMGQNRALSAEEFLTRQGIAKDRVRLTGRVGEEGRTLWVRFIPDTGAAVKKVQVTSN